MTAANTALESTAAAINGYATNGHHPKTDADRRMAERVSVVEKSFGEQVDDVIAIALNLAHLRANDDYDAFQEACVTAGLDQTIDGRQEPRLYWDLMMSPKPSVTTTVGNARTPTQLALALGIQLSNDRVARCTLLYRLIEQKFPDLFRMLLVPGPHVGGKQARHTADRRKLLLHQGPSQQSWNANLCRIFQGHHPSDFVDCQLAEKCKPLQQAMGRDAGLKLGKLLFELKMILPNAQISQLLNGVLQRGKAGRTVTLVGAFCPDYAYERTDDPNLPYRYTFDGLGTDVGLVALQFVRVIPPLSRLLTEMGVSHRIVLGIGDFEADSADVLRRVGCDYGEFVSRCSKSLDAFRAQIGPDLPVTLELCDADRCKGRLRPYGNEATARMLRGDFGRMGELYPDPNRVVDRIVKDNGAFYKRWYSPDMTDDQIRAIVLNQGGEYAALARIYAEDFGHDDVIVISGDRPMMHAFDAVYAVQPVLCVKRAY